MKPSIVALAIMMGPYVALAFDSDTANLEQLPAAQTSGGQPLMDVLRQRKSTREFKPEALDRQQLANLLWAAFGVNRSETGQRTAPSTMNLRSVDIYIATTQGVYRYDAPSHALVLISHDDVRAATGGQDYVKIAPVALIYVSDHAKLTKAAAEERAFYGAADTGFIGQNVYLYCASAGLGCVVHMPGDRAAMAKALQLRADQHIVLVHSVGVPAQ